MARHTRMVALMRKEMTQFLRARFMLVLILYMYTGEVLMCTFAMSFDVRNLPTVFADFDGSAASRALIERFQSSGYFNIEHLTTRNPEVAALLNRGAAMAAIIVPPEFSQRLAEGSPAAVQLLLDGSNANTAAVAQGYAQRIVMDYALERGRALVDTPLLLPVEHRPRVWYNAELRYAYFMALSMIALSGTMVGVITVAAGIVREKESGTIEQLMVTPVTSTEMIIAKMMPTLVIGLLALFPSLLIAAWIGVPMRGSLVLFFLFSAVFLISSMGVGILIATVAETMQQALLISFLILFPVLFLSGTVVPLESMPVALQYLAALSPLRHYMEAILGIFFKGAGLEMLWPRLLAMIAIGVALLAVCVVRFKRRMS